MRVDWAVEWRRRSEVSVVRGGISSSLFIAQSVC